MRLPGTGVTHFMPANIDSPGFAEENRTKPAACREIEGASTPISPESCAKMLMDGIESGACASGVVGCLCTQPHAV